MTYMSRDRRPSYTFFLMGKEPIQIQHTVIGIAQTNVIILFVAIGDVKGQILIKRIYLIYVCLCIVVSNTYCVVILLCFSSSCVSLDCPFLIVIRYYIYIRYYISCKFPVFSLVKERVPI